MLSSFRAIAPLRLASTRTLSTCIRRLPASQAARKTLVSLPARSFLPTYRTFANTGFLRQEAAQVPLDATDAIESIDQLGSTEAAQTPAPKKNGLPTKFAELLDYGIDQRLVNTITNGLKYEDMTEVQSKTIPTCAQGADVIARAKTGTGKTLAFLIPTISQLLKKEVGVNRDDYQRPSSRTQQRSRADVRAIIISPTRELALQITKDAVTLTRGTPIKVASMVGGTGKQFALNDFHRYGCHILIGTPGRLADVLSDRSANVSAQNVETLIYDEADSLMQGGFEKETREIKSYLPEERQTLMFSATMPDKVRSLIAETMKPNHQFINTVDPREAETHTKVPQHLIMVNNYENQLPTLFELLYRENNKAKKAGEPFKAMVFFGTARGTDLVALAFRRLMLEETPGHPLYPLELIQIHSRLTQARRTLASNAFKQCTNGILFSSDVTARGMDFPNVTHVIQVGAPTNREQYIHRIGRTARGKNIESGKSVGYVILSPLEARHTLRELRGLNIRTDENEDLVSPTANLENLDSLDENAAKYAKAIVGAMQKLDPRSILTTYSALMGATLQSSENALEVVEALYRWTKFNCGLSKPPYMSASLAQKMAIPHRKAVQLGFIGTNAEDFGGAETPEYGRSLDGSYSRPPRGRDSSGMGRRPYRSNDDSGFGGDSGDGGRSYGGDRSYGDRPPRRSSYGESSYGESSYGGSGGSGRSYGGSGSGGRSYGGSGGGGGRSYGGSGGRGGKSSYGSRGGGGSGNSSPWERRGRQSQRDAY